MQDNKEKQLKEMLSRLCHRFRSTLTPRNPNRIPEVLEEIRKVWEQHPDMRLTQLIGNVFHGDNYHVEDDKLVDGIKNFYGKIGNQQGTSED